MISSRARLVLLAWVPPAVAESGWAVVDPVPGDHHLGVATCGFQVQGSPPDSNWFRYSDERNLP